MNLYNIPSQDTQDFFRLDSANLKYQSKADPAQLITSDPWQTYLNFKFKTHLPWLSLDLNSLTEPMPVEKILEEARAVQHLAVAHRYEEDSSANWKSLCIHGLDPEKTLHAEAYGMSEDETTPYRWTEIADLCPTTTMYFKKVFPHSHYQRLRFMYLEPKGFIAPHEDVIDPQPHFTAINIALNQPRACHFLMGGTNQFSTERWGMVPFRHGGDAFWLDLRNYHSVVNLSSETRIHIIVHSYIKKEDLSRLQKFNSMFPTHKDKIQNVQAKKLNVAVKSPKIAVGILDLNYSSEPNPTLDYYTRLTERFLPAMTTSDSCAKVSSSMDEILEWACEQTDQDYLLVLSSGTIIFESESFWRNIVLELGNIENAGVAVWGHIIDRGAVKSMGFHMQTLVLDLQKYRQYGSKNFGEWTEAPLELKRWERSKEDVHDDYTPIYLKPEEGSVTVERGCYGWRLIDDTLRAGFELRNFNEAVRQTKIHGYPEDNFHILKDYIGKKVLTSPLPHPELEEGQNEFLFYFQRLAKEASRTVWIHNNENWDPLPEKLDLHHIHYIAAPSGGGVDYHLFRQLDKHDDIEILHYDISQPCLDFKQAVVQTWKHKDEPFHSFLKKYKLEHSEEILYTEHQSLWDSQNYDKLKYEESWERYTRARHHFYQMDIVGSFRSLIDRLPDNKQGIIMFSNIFNFLPWLWVYSDTEIKESFWSLIEGIAKKSPDNLIVGKGLKGQFINYVTADQLLSDRL